MFHCQDGNAGISFTHVCRRLLEHTVTALFTYKPLNLRYIFLLLYTLSTKTNDTHNDRGTSTTFRVNTLASQNSYGCSHNSIILEEEGETPAVQQQGVMHAQVSTCVPQQSSSWLSKATIYTLVIPLLPLPPPRPQHSSTPALQHQHLHQQVCIPPRRHHPRPLSRPRSAAASTTNGLRRCW